MKPTVLPALASLLVLAASSVLAGPSDPVGSLLKIDRRFDRSMASSSRPGSGDPISMFLFSHGQSFVSAGGLPSSSCGLELFTTLDKVPADKLDPKSFTACRVVGHERTKSARVNRTMNGVAVDWTDLVVDQYTLSLNCVFRALVCIQEEKGSLDPMKVLEDSFGHPRRLASSDPYPAVEFVSGGRPTAAASTEDKNLLVNGNREKRPNRELPKNFPTADWTRSLQGASSI